MKGKFRIGNCRDIGARVITEKRRRAPRQAAKKGVFGHDCPAVYGFVAPAPESSRGRNHGARTEGSPPTAPPDGLCPCRGGGMVAWVWAIFETFGWAVGAE